MLTSESAPLKSNQIQQWITSLSADEIKRQGWTPASLNESFGKYHYIYLKAGEQVASVLIYQKLDKDLLEVLFLATSQDLKRQGFMFVLLSEFTESFRDDYRLWLECREDNHPAQNLYRKVGFKEAGKRPTYYKDGTSAILFNI